MKWSNEQNVISVGLALVEAQKPGTFDIHRVRQLVGPGKDGTPFGDVRWDGLVEELRRSLPDISPAVQDHCRTGRSKTKRLCMSRVP